jgi:UDP-2,3-diacylglucosamine pyrophosphatase LpxH
MHDLIVLSDLHLGRGRNPETGRYHALETFFYDEDFRRFCRHASAEARSRQKTLRLVFNGDTFDLLRFEPEFDPGASRRERRFGSDRTPHVAAMQVGSILSGHPVFVSALADILEGGHEIVFLPGNHDLEVQWEPVQQRIRSTVERSLNARGIDAAAAKRIRFEPWFLHEPGRIWIEHGCQYEPECAFRFPLRSTLANRLDADASLLELDMPLGNFLQRYLYNGLGSITFIVPGTRANARYTRWLLFNEPRLLVRVLANHVPFGLQVLRRLSQGGAEKRQALQQAHQAELDALASNSGLGEVLRTIDGFKTVEGDLVQTVRQLGFQVVKFVLLAIAVALASAGLWSSGFLAINDLKYGVGFKSLLFLLLNFVLMVSAVGFTITLLLRSGPLSSPTSLRDGAQRIADVLNVPVVTFGHSHDENVARLPCPSGRRAWYYNTGTWIAVFTGDILIPRERVQYTFLRMRELEAELLHWSPGRDEALPVVLLDELQADETATRFPLEESQLGFPRTGAGRSRSEDNITPVASPDAPAPARSGSGRL